MPPTLAPPMLAQWNHVFTMLETEPKGTLRAAHKWLLEPEQGHTTAAEAPAPAARFEAADLASSVQHTTGPGAGSRRARLGSNHGRAHGAHAGALQGLPGPAARGEDNRALRSRGRPAGRSMSPSRRFWAASAVFARTATKHGRSACTSGPANGACSCSGTTIGASRSPRSSGLHAALRLGTARRK